MPSSSDEVATSAREATGLQQILDLDAAAAARSIRDASARAFRPASSFSAPASRSARRRLLTKIRVERCARISSSSRGWMADQIDGRASPTDAGPLGMSSAVVSFAMSSTGTSMVSASAFFLPASTMVTGDSGRRRDAPRTRARFRHRSSCRRGVRLCQRRGGLGGSSCADARRFRSSEESRDLVERTLGGRQPDALRRTLAACLEPFERDGAGARRAWSARARESRR